MNRKNAVKSNLASEWTCGHFICLFVFCYTNDHITHKLTYITQSILLEYFYERMMECNEFSVQLVHPVLTKMIFLFRPIHRQARKSTFLLQ